MQRVGYRAWTEREALRHGISGWVRNRADGSVEALLAGDPAAVEAMIAACWRGPRMARIESIDVFPADATAQRSAENGGFVVLRDE